MTQQYLNIGGVIGLILVALAMGDVLLCENIPLLSINITQTMISHWARHWHVIAIALLPIYIAILFFGASMLGLWLGSMIQHGLTRFCHKFIQL